MTEMTELKTWASEHNYSDKFNEYVKEREKLSVDCTRDGLSPYGYDFELRDKALKNYYNEIFQDKEVIKEREHSLELASVLIKNNGVFDISKALSDFYDNHEPNEPYLWEDAQKVIYDTMEEKLSNLGELPNLYFTPDSVSDIVDAMQSILNKEDLSNYQTKYQLLNIEVNKDIEIPKYHTTSITETEKYMTDMINKSTKYDEIQEVNINMRLYKDNISKLLVTTQELIEKEKDRYEEIYRPLENEIRKSIDIEKYPEFKDISMVMYKVYKDANLEPDKRAEDIFPCETLQELYTKECERILRECEETDQKDIYEKRIEELYNEPRFAALKEERNEEIYVGMDPDALLYMVTQSPTYHNYEDLFKTMLDQEPERERRNMPEYEPGDIDALFELSNTDGMKQYISEYLMENDIEGSVRADLHENIINAVTEITVQPDLSRQMQEPLPSTDEYNYEIRDTNRNKDISQEEIVEFDDMDINMDIDMDIVDGIGGDRDIRDLNGDNDIDTEERKTMDKEKDEEFEFEL